MSIDYILINPPSMKNYRNRDIDECLGLGYINASLQKQFRGYIVNCYSNKMEEDDLFENKKIIEDILTSLVVGISCNFFTNLPSTVYIVKELRKIGYKGFIVLGGHQAVLSKEILLKKLPINAISIGDGDVSMVNLLQSIKFDDFHYVDGFIYKKGHQIINDYGKIALPDLTTLPFPSRLGDVGHDIYKDEIKRNVRGTYISTSRGCPFRCRYCDISTFYGGKRRQRSIGNVLDEIQYLYEMKGRQEFHFTDDNFIGSSKSGLLRVYDFVEGIKERKLHIRFSMEARVTDITYNIVIALREVGLSHINLGIESGSQSMLDRWNKGIKVADSLNALKILENVGVNYNINYILSDPFMTYDELSESYDFLLRVRAAEKSENYFSLFTNEMGIFDGTELATELRVKGILLSKKMRNATQEEQECLDIYHPIYYYRYMDEKVACFIENNCYWTEKIADILKEVSKEFGASLIMRRFCFKLFTMSYTAAKEMKKIFTELDIELESFKKINYI